jgi:hypothetical protein
MTTNVNGVLDTPKIVNLFQFIMQNQTIFIKSRLTDMGMDFQRVPSGYLCSGVCCTVCSLWDLLRHR